jgi:signal transduction histidine kinase
MFWVAYSLLVIMGAAGVASLPPGGRWPVAVGLLAALALVMLWPLRTRCYARGLPLYLALQIALIGGLLLLGSDSAAFGFLLFLPSAEAASAWPPRRAFRWAAFCFLLIAAHSLLSWGRSGLLNVLFNLGGFAFVGTFGHALRQAELARRGSQALYESLQAAQRQLQDLAVAEERNRLARELHDSLGHRLTVAVVQLEGAQRLIPTDPGRAARMTGAMRAQLKEALADLRGAVAALRDDAPGVNGAPAAPLPVALADLARAFTDSTGLPVHLALPPECPPLPAAHRLALYRAAQEALTNTQRHAAASQAWLTMSLAPGQVTLTAADDGHGFEAPADSGGGFGLRGLRERALALGGEMVLAPRPGGGAQLGFSLPLPVEA